MEEETALVREKRREGYMKLPIGSWHAHFALFYIGATQVLYFVALGVIFLTAQNKIGNFLHQY